MKESKVLWYSNSGHLLTGYGRPTKKICTFLHKAGYDVEILGHQTLGSVQKLPCDGHCEEGILTLPSKPHHMGSDDMAGVARRSRRNVFIMHHDPWAWPIAFYQEVAQLMDFVFYGPIDHAPLSPYMIQRLQRPTATLIVAQTIFGKRQVDAVAPEQGVMPNCGMIPATVDCKVFRPMAEVKKRRDDEKRLRFIYVKANKGERANIPSLLKSFKWFLKEEKKAGRDLKPEDAELYLHCEPDSRLGYELSLYIRMLGLTDYVTFPRDYCADAKCLGRTDFVVSAWVCKTCKGKCQDLNASEEWLSTILNYSHAQFNTCDSEGFGIPIVEALASGCPTFHTDFGGGAEHIPPEWRIKIAGLRTTPLLADHAYVDEEDIMLRMRKLLAEREDWLPKAQRLAHRIGQSYDDTIVLPQWLGVMEQLDAHVARRHDAKWGPLAGSVPGKDVSRIATIVAAAEAEAEKRVQSIEGLGVVA